MSCEDFNFENLSELDYAKDGISKYLNNEPIKAIEYLDKRKDTSLLINYCSVLLQVANSIISFDKAKISAASALLKELERKCEPSGWLFLSSLKSRIFGNHQSRFLQKSLLDELEKQIILADCLLCSAILTSLDFEVSSYIKAALILRRAWKIYHQTFKQIQDLCCQYFFPEEASIKIDSIYNSHDLSSPTSECSAFTVPLRTNNVPQNSLTSLQKSQSTVFNRNSSTRPKTLGVRTNFSNLMHNDESMSKESFKRELMRHRGAIYFGYGLLQLAFSFLPPQLKLINFLGYQGDRNIGINCLYESKSSEDVRSLLSAIALLWYFLIVTPFYALENSDLSEEISNATQLLNEYEQFDQSALFLFFSGRRQRLKKKIKYAIIHYDAAVRASNIPRELKIFVMHELGVCLLIQLNYHDAMHYFNELKVSKFSKSYYLYLTAICHGSHDNDVEKFQSKRELLTKVISGSSQKDGIIEKFIMNRCNHVLLPLNDVQENSFWQLLCFEVMYLWNLLPSCDATTLNSIINVCHETSAEPILGLSHFVMGTCYAILGDFENSIEQYKRCLEKCNENLSILLFPHVPAYANYELSILYLKYYGNAPEARHHLQLAQQFKSYDFEYRLKLKMQNVRA